MRRLITCTLWTWPTRFWKTPRSVMSFVGTFRRKHSVYQCIKNVEISYHFPYDDVWFRCVLFIHALNLETYLDIEFESLWNMCITSSNYFNISSWVLIIYTMVITFARVCKLSFGMNVIVNFFLHSNVFMHYLYIRI